MGDMLLNSGRKLLEDHAIATLREQTVYGELWATDLGLDEHGLTRLTGECLASFPGYFGRIDATVPDGHAGPLAMRVFNGNGVELARPFWRSASAGDVVAWDPDQISITPS